MSSRKLVVIAMSIVLMLSLAAMAAEPKGFVAEGIKKDGLPENVKVNDTINTSTPGRTRPGSVIVRLEGGVSASSLSAFEDAVAALGGTVKKQLEMSGKAEGVGASAAGGLKFAFLDFGEDADTVEMAAKVAKIAGVRYAEPDYAMYADYVTPTPPESFFLGYQYYLDNQGDWGYGYGTQGSDIKAFVGWDYANDDFGLDSSSVVVGVIDTGVAYWIPELTPNMWVNEEELEGEDDVDDDGNGYIDDVYGYDFYHDLGIGTETGWIPNAEDDHGSHVAGTIAASWEYGSVAGVTYNTKIMTLKFLGEGGGWTSDAIRALDYAVEMGADLTSNSWGGGDPSMALADAIRESGMLFISSAGNDGDNGDFYGHYPSTYAKPGSPYFCENIISVAATDANDNLASFSNFGPESVHIAAPGNYILNVAADGDYSYGYYFYSGTSMATPQVSAVASLLVAQDKFHPGYSIPQYDDPDPSGNWDTIKEIILNSAEKKEQLKGLVSTGGRLSMIGALTWTRYPGVASIDVTPTYSSTIPVTVDCSVEIDGGDSASAASIDPIVHRWSLNYIDTYYGTYDKYQVSDYAYGLDAELPCDPDGFGVYYVLYEMYNSDIDKVVASSYKQVLFAAPEDIVAVFDDTYDGWIGPTEDIMVAFGELGLSFHAVTPPLTLPHDIPNVVFWNTSLNTSGVITEQDAQWIIGFLNHGGKLFLTSFEMLNMIEGYDRVDEDTFEVMHESALSEDTKAELLEALKIRGFITDFTLKQLMAANGVPLYEDVIEVAGDTILYENEIDLYLDYDYWSYVSDGSPVFPNYGDVVTDFGPGAYPILLSEYGGAIDEYDRAALGVSYAGDDYRFIFLGFPIEVLQGQWENFVDFIGFGYEFLMGEGPNRLTGWFENPLTGDTVSNPVDVAWGITDVEYTNHGTRLWFRADEDDAWEPITLFVPGEDFEYEWDFGHTLLGAGYQVKMEVFDAADPTRVAYDFEGPFSIWPANAEEGARAGVDRDAEEIIFFVNAEKPGTLYVYDLSGAMLFSEAVPAGISEVTWDMMVNGLRIARGLYAFRLVYNDGSASKTGRVLINF